MQDHTCAGVKINNFSDNTEEAEGKPTDAEDQWYCQEYGGGPLLLFLVDSVQQPPLLEEVVDLAVDDADDEEGEEVLEEDTDDGVAESVLLLQSRVLTVTPVLHTNLDLLNLLNLIIWEQKIRGILNVNSLRILIPKKRLSSTWLE